MTTITGVQAPVARRVWVARAYRFEMVKLLAQWRVRLLMLACAVAPALFVAVVSQQAALPVDTLFGRSMHATGWAGSLVILGFSGTWALPLVTSLIAGDVFASEDRLGTWRHLLVAVRSPWRIFVSKALASLTVIVVLVILKQYDFYNPQVLFLVSIAGVIGSAVLDARAVQRGRVGYFEG
jgi:ABC-2 type transport system permease protein